MFHYYWHEKCFQVISQSHPFCIQGSVDQRLKWAVGANPGLQEVWTLFRSLSYILIWCKSLYYQVVHIWWKSLLSGGWPSCRRASCTCGGSQATWGLGEVYHQHRGGLLAGGRFIVKKILSVFVFKQFEALRTSTTEARASDHQFLGILSLCRSSQSTHLWTQLRLSLIIRQDQMIHILKRCSSILAIIIL